MPWCPNLLPLVFCDYLVKVGYLLLRDVLMEVFRRLGVSRIGLDIHVGKRTRAEAFGHIHRSLRR
jgi:hypothetical protein